ncbi:ABC-2 type transport system ATP-binding protein [Pelomonas aquatica]|uniref:ABC-2 type transport system ATP-binding protein n=1 Tax=Pelomonas aquatica TaxID=431058 RepID=A0ABU1Z786_9BURK|nr:ABC transporter ATP-binding protein [Pelomonas aquatica]MDR7295581.1 ABC-2 type transport system ATP-binding protein [Pelomonas aquatica]
MTHAIEARQLSLSFNNEADWGAARSRVLDRIDLAVPEGAVVGLVGRNGAGKSTLMRCLLGLTTPSEGEARLLGEPSRALTDAVRERLGYAAQTPDLFPRLTGREHLQEMAAVYPGVHLRDAIALAARLDLPLGRRADALSLGDQQKLAVVLALAHDPDLLLLDEPVASLDPISRRDFMRALFTLRRRVEPRTVLVSSHLLSDLERVVSHVLFLREGRVQLFVEWDEAMEHLRCVPAEQPEPGGLHWSAAQGGRLLVDRRQRPDAAGQPGLGMEDLLELLNT